MQGRNGVYLGLGSMMTALLLSIQMHSPWATPGNYSDLMGSFWGRDWLQAGSLPYVNSSYSAFEYPPVSGLLLYATKAIGVTYDGYYLTFAALSVAAGAVIVLSCWSIARRSGRELGPFYFMLPSFVVYGIYNFDLFHAMFVILSLQFFLKGNRKLSALFLGLAVSTKLASGVLLPLFILESKGTRPKASFLAVFLAVVGAVNIPFAALNFNNFLAGYQFIGNWGLEDAWYVWIFQSPNNWFIAKIFGLGIAAFLLIFVYSMKGDLTSKIFLALAAYLLGTYIYSPQFNLLLLPIIAVLDLKSPWLFLWEGFNAMIILTWFIPGSSPTLPGSWPQAFSLFRAVSLAFLSVSLIPSGSLRLPQILRGRGQSAEPPPAGPVIGVGTSALSRLLQILRYISSCLRLTAPRCGTSPLDRANPWTLSRRPGLRREGYPSTSSLGPG